MKYRPNLLSVSPLAVDKIKQMIAQRGTHTKGIRISIRTKGCSGLSYTLEYCDASQPADEIIDTNDIKIFIDPKSVIFLIGTVIDYKEEEFSQGFVFTNPNEKGRCGCGSSFHI